ncbi:hypothetical protein TEA_017726 [Camellia sinensis var. sinensis]|uniref:Protein kinase domain-containing protein n=1 Tax=Camellia sinensis var. sinensis TaxID=542762 RepID=A0A4S4DBA7_CAMSN|nr:hypothetical protein TEA_017726 [Camellia sinensis var. sinensis]
MSLACATLHYVEKNLRKKSPSSKGKKVDNDAPKTKRIKAAKSIGKDEHILESSQCTKPQTSSPLIADNGDGKEMESQVEPGEHTRCNEAVMGESCQFTENVIESRAGIQIDNGVSINKNEGDIDIDDIPGFPVSELEARISRLENFFAQLKAARARHGSKRRYIAEEIAKIGKGNITAQIFTFKDLSAATQNFNPDCLDVAVKQLDRNGFQGNREFLVEVLMLSLLHHPNLVNLVGYCADGDQRILVYEFMANGSLEDHLLDLAPNKKPLDWCQRMKIAEGAARGLEYLHETANPPVIYRDFKASNILLDEDFNPKLSDFGLAKLGPTGDKSHVSTRVMGTYGYCAPEYALTGQLTTKSDVYSFGVVFLEIITGRRVIDNARPSDEQNLVTWAQPLFKDKRKFTLMADPLLEGKYPIKGLYQALAIAAMCLQEEDSVRPLISDVVTALEFLSTGSKDEDEEEGDAEEKTKLPSASGRNIAEGVEKSSHDGASERD